MRIDGFSSWQLLDAASVAVCWIWVFSHKGPQGAEQVNADGLVELVATAPPPRACWVLGDSDIW
jgi:hypothetical protein